MSENLKQDETSVNELNSTKKVAFFLVFVKSLAFFMSLLTVYSITYLAFRGVVKTNAVKASSLADASQTVNSNSVNNSYVEGLSSDGSSQAQADDSNKTLVVDINKTPQTIAEIVAYYNAANAKVKSQAKSVTKTYERTSNYQDVLETGNSAVLSKIAKSIMNTFVKENTEPTVHEGAAEISANFPPSNSKCNLTENDVAKATCVDKGSYYEIEIHTKPEADPKEGYGAGALGSVITREQISAAVEGYVSISNVKCEYDDVYIIANVEKSTGNMTYEYVHMPLFLNLTALNMNCKVGLLFEDKWEIKW